MSGTVSTAMFSLAEDRGVIAISGADARSFLQGLVSADVLAVTATTARWAALLTPQGKFLYDLVIAADGDTLLLDCEAGRRQALLSKLGPYRLRADVALADRTEALAVACVWGEGALAALGLPAEPGSVRPWQGGLAVVDPRLAVMGARVIGPRAGLDAALAGAGLSPGDRADWDRLRITAGIPDGSRDLEPEKAILLENGFDELGGIAWDKGCWMGQELTARTRYRGLVKKRLLPVRVTGALPPAGTVVVREDGREAGELRSGAGDVALALLRLDALGGGDDAPTPLLRAGDASLEPLWPAWLDRRKLVPAPP